MGGVAGDFRKEIESDADGERDINQVGLGNRWLEIAGEGFVEGAACGFLANHFWAVPAGDVDVGEMLFQGESEGAADQAGAEDGDSADEVSGHERRSLQSAVKR